MTAELQATRVDLTGLLEVLGKNLYSTPSVAVRELVQNAHDACVRRKIESGPFEARIHIRTEAGRKRLIIEDNGAGLTREEIVEHLATIGSGYTRLLRNRTRTEEMIGYFGLGFLSAYVVGRRVEMWTTSYREPGTSWRFVSNSGERFSITAAENGPVGSRVTLDLAEDFTELADSGFLAFLLNKYCRLLPIPVHLNDDVETVNRAPAPWRLDSHAVSPLRLKRLRHEFVASLDDEFEPLCEIPIVPSEDCHLEGVIWLHDGSSYANADNRRATVFVRGMYITGDARELMPGWAGFASCVVESSGFTPTASREDLQKDAFYHHAREHIHRALVDGLIHIARHEPETWQRILRRHNEGLLGAAISDQALFDAVSRALKVPSSEGDYALPELLKQSGNKLIVTMEEKGNYEEILCRAQKVPVIHGYRYAVLGFVRRYAQDAFLELNLLGSKGGSDALFAPAHVPGDQLEELRSMFARPREKLVPVEFEPDYIPLLLVPDEDALLKSRIESDEAQERISTSALGLAKLYTEKIQGESLAYLYINMASPLIRRIFEQGRERRVHLANMIRSFMIVLGHNERLATVDPVAQELRTYSDSLLQLYEG